MSSASLTTQQLSNLSATQLRQLAEVARCVDDPIYFLKRFGQIYDPKSKQWVAFDLWPAQEEVLRAIDNSKQVCVLKARQLGLSWLTLGYALWAMLFKPIQTVLIFSQRDPDAKYLLGDERLRGMFNRLPSYLKHGIRVLNNDAHLWTLSNGSTARAFPTTGGRSYAATLAIVDEADFVEDLESLLNAVKPTVDAGGKLVAISTSDKSRPESMFKRLYRMARAGESDWKAIFLPWHARPDRTPEWYTAQAIELEARDGTLDNLWQEYPATDAEALASRSLDKRFLLAWIEQCTKLAQPIARPEDARPNVPGFKMWRKPEVARYYIIGADPAEGNVLSDESAATIIDDLTGEQVALLAGKYDPSVFGEHIAAMSAYYNDAQVLVERNNHGHACLLWLRDNAPRVPVLAGLDSNPGWLQTSRGKAVLCDSAGIQLRERNVTLHDSETAAQLYSIEGNTMRAPDGLHDDRAIAFMLALAGWRYGTTMADSGLIANAFAWRG